ncbi:MAG: DUF3472 domain-containing protein [Clostridia bacterium]|nr:DUF3472 domain-containing protein [Clostridia bacterium]
MKKHLRKALLLLLAATMLLGSLTPLCITAEEKELKYMAYNFYSDPDLSDTSRKFDSFMIDFRSDKDTKITYWSLANFRMDLRSPKTMKTYPGISGYGAYAGLQHTSTKVGILSFWEAAYTNKDGETEKLTATRIFPKGSSNFGGEGEGTNCIMPYSWEKDKWYRMLLHCWEDSETGTTFAGMWLLDVESGKWTLFSYFDTHLYDSYFSGGFSQFMENFSGGDVNTNCNVERTCQLKNMYVYDHEKKDWISLPSTTLSYGDGNPQTEGQKKFGAHSFGATEEYFWGSTGGKVENQEEYDAASTKYDHFTITQPETPTFGAPSVGYMYIGKNVRWVLAEDSTPQLGYSVQVVDTSGKVVFEKAATRPQESSVKLPEGLPEALKATVTVTDVFGGTTTSEIANDAYLEATGQKPKPEEPSEDASSELPSASDLSEIPSEDVDDNDEKEKKSPVLPIVIGTVAASAVLIAGITVAVIVFRKKRVK